MILCVDIGNTSIKLARAGRGGVGRVQVISSASTQRDLARAIARVGKGGVEHAAIASVRPAATAAVSRALRRELGFAPLVVTHRTRLPIEVATRHPARVGIDRLCAASGAVGRRARHAIVVDAGTAITVDLVLDLRLVGGLIMPGPQMMLSAMHHFTAQLPDLRLEARDTGRFDDTAAAMRTGVTVGSVGAILLAARLLQGHAGRPVTVWVTGGHAPRLRKSLPSHWKFERHLTLQGLLAIARLNPPSR